MKFCKSERSLANCLLKSGEASTNLFSNIASSNLSARKKTEDKGNYILVENNVLSNQLSSEGEPLYSTAEMSFIDEEQVYASSNHQREK